MISSLVFSTILVMKEVKIFLDKFAADRIGNLKT